MKRVSAIEYDGKWNEVANATFEWVDQAIEWCEARVKDEAPAGLHWGDTQIGLEGNTDSTIQALNDNGIHPDSARIFQIQAINDEDPQQIEELQSCHYDPAKMDDESLKLAWDEATQTAEETDEWELVSVIETEVNKRGLNQKGG